jgi:hypothetical protein
MSTFLTAKEYTEPRNSTVKQRLFYDVVWITKQGNDFLLDHFMKSQQLNIIAGWLKCQIMQTKINVPSNRDVLQMEK